MATPDFLYNDETGDMPALSELGQPQALAGLSSGATRNAQPAPQDPNRLGMGQWLGLALEGFTSGFQGRAPQGMNILMKQQEMNRQKEKEDKAMAFEQFKAIKEVFPILEMLKDSVREEKRPAMAKTLAATFKNIGIGDMFDEDNLTEIMSGGSSFDQFKNNIEFLKSVPDEMGLQVYRAYKKSPEAGLKMAGDLALNFATKHVQKGEAIPPSTVNALDSDRRKRLSEAASPILFKQLMADAETDPAIKKLTTAQARARIPNFDLLSDEHILAAREGGFENFKTKGVIEQELKDKPAADRQQAAFAQQDKRDAVTEERRARDHADLQRERAIDNARQSAIFQQSQDNIDRRHIETLQAALQRPLEKSDRESIAAMEENLNIARRLKNNFTDEERKKYVGILANPTSRAMQLVKGDTKFAQFQTLTNEVKGFAFAEGGKQLTETEKRITWGHLPVGTEFSVADYVANLDRTLERTESLIRRRVELATTPRNRISTPANQKVLTKELAIQFKRQAGGDSAKARKLAKDQGYEIPSE